MSEVLSQTQIDALLSAALSGGMNLDSSERGAQEKKYRKYDFYSPRKFTKDRIKMLDSIFDNYTRMINSRLNSLLHTNGEIAVDSVEEQRYYEFSNAITEGDALSLIYLHYKEEREETPLLLFITKPVALSMMDRLLGGDGAIPRDLPADYTLTDVELRLYESIIRDMVSGMASSWENYLPLKFEYGRVEANPTMVQLIGLDETVVIVDISLKFSNSEGRLSICLPGMMLTNLFAEISRKNPGRRTNTEDQAQEIFDSLRDSSLEIVAELGTTNLQLNDIYHLSIGDVIDLKQPKDSPIYLNIGGRRWFDGRVGIYNKNMAVKIGETYI